ncbi:MAG: xanthine dehydrogenase family protein subunit M [Proteobacteria bacterium]|nr:xanthine dehydrogenase family protein subunit M [Desulfobacula sp.]MBU3954391.1 xanthine dehydrogenase family protein subunit M [Pseudomonadota bacterium]MBU4129547.1 xanthine dehydrogenase family protein subunit M [Pseudomonadota bacterium]
MKVHLPESLDALWDLLDQHPQAGIMAGGTDLLVSLRAGKQHLPTVICLERLAPLQTIEPLDQTLRIGAGVTLTRILENSLVHTHLPLLHKSVASLGSPLVRNMATLGGNICTASPAGDTLPALYVLGAKLSLASAKGRRILPLESFIQGPGKTALAKGEILDSVIIPFPAGFGVQHFEKLGQRNALAISVVSFAALIRTQDNLVQRARFAWGSVGPTIVRSPQAEKALEGNPLSLEALLRVADLARAAVEPITDVRASADYRRRVAGNMVLRLAAL